MHMLKLYDYLADCDSFALTPSIEQPKIEFNNVIEVFQKAYEAEKRVTAAILKLVELCFSEHDYLTLNFLQWYLMEQREEEAQALSILDRIKLIGEGPQALYYVDKELERFNAAADKKD
jgi:ferritin